MCIVHYKPAVVCLVYRVYLLYMRRVYTGVSASKGTIHPRLNIDMAQHMAGFARLGNLRGAR